MDFREMLLDTDTIGWMVVTVGGLLLSVLMDGYSRFISSEE